MENTGDATAAPVSSVRSMTAEDHQSTEQIRSNFRKAQNGETQPIRVRQAAQGTQEKEEARGKTRA
jgi:hypothetical protein